ncbi:MAG TPA: ester cyclase [Terriglobales bacterium]|nr:ester cyclase [Terriglobales bacterium]
MGARENIDIVRRWFEEVWNQGLTSTVHELLAADAVCVGQSEQGTVFHGPADFEPFIHRTRGAFPDIHVVIEDAFGSKDKVAVRWSATMTHKGDHLGMPATGKTVRITGTTIARIRDGKIVQGWDNWDQLGLMQQIGAFATPPSALSKTA